MPYNPSEWKESANTISAFKQSTQLKDITTAVDAYCANPTSYAKKINIQAALATWEKSALPNVVTEKTTLAPAVTKLKTFLATVSGPTITSSITARGWTPKAWSLAAYAWTTAVPPVSALKELSPSKISRVNETISRAGRAAISARDVVIQVARKKLVAPLNDDDRLFVDYFGNNPTHCAIVAERFKILALAFSNSPVMVDVRNTVFGLTCYAACLRNDLTTKASGSLTLNGRVEMFLGRDFFKTGSYDTTTDATVGTLIHEFAHGAFSAVDAPKVDASNNWELTPSADEEWASPVNSEQSSTVELDKRLAAKEPRAAIVNADNYEFARLLLQRNQR